MTRGYASGVILLLLAAPVAAHAQVFEEPVPDPAGADRAASPDAGPAASDPAASTEAEAAQATPAQATPAQPAIAAEDLAVPAGYGAPTPPTRRRASSRRTVRLDVLGFGDGPLTLHLRNPVGDPQEIAGCRAPCGLEIEPGRYDLAVSPPGGGPHRADGQPMFLDGSRVAVQMHYDHRGALRVLGWVFFSIAATALSLSTLGGPFSALLIGTPIAAAFLIPWLPLVFLEDSARVQATRIPD